MNSIMKIDGAVIRQDGQGRYSLNDLHRAAGGEKRHGPSYFLSNQQTQALLAELETTGIPVVTTEGRNGGSYVAKELVYAYAMWISASFHLKVIRTFDEVAMGRRALAKSHAADTVRALAICKKEIDRVVGVKPEMAMAVFLQAVEKATGLPTTEMRLALPGAAVEEAKKLNPTQLAAALTNGSSAKAVNLALIDLMLQKKTERGYVITDAGIAHGEMTPFNRNGHSGYQPLWFESVLELLRLHFAARSNVVSIQ